MAEDTVGKKRARALLKDDPEFFKRIGSVGGKRTQELYPNVRNFVDKELARKAGLRGLKSQGKA